ncbi:hypothetical protein AJ78_08095 [Emergomyces pasteurianus Ep9510]|uniref:RING-type domain-containing protein n=1 Tax=Emergomyces pasteurianus Ep9510 TaxID=1447872 RepID=A0A1J9Q557_9EURO|nr:hypothetical protein AJ78_08095 [Emergomyces pasteurianus Ep9510]
MPNHPSNGQRQTAVITPPSQRFTIQPPLQQNQDHHPQQGEFHPQTSRVPRHAASSSYPVGQAASNPHISHHRAYMSVDSTGMAGRNDYASQGAAIPANLQTSVASESAQYTPFSNQQSQGQTQDQLGANGFWDSGNHRINDNLQTAFSREAAFNYGYFPVENQQMYYSTVSQSPNAVTGPFTPMESRQQGNLGQSDESRATIQNQGPFNPTSLNRSDPYSEPESIASQPVGHNLFSRFPGTSMMANNDNPLNSFSFQYLPVDYHNTQFHSHSSVDNAPLNTPPVPRNAASSYSLGPSPSVSRLNNPNPNQRRRSLHAGVPSFSSPPAAGAAGAAGSLNANSTTGTRRRARRVYDGGISQSGPVPRGDQRQPHRHNQPSVSGIGMGMPGGTSSTARDQSYVNAHIARLLYSGALVHYPNDPEVLYFGNEAERRRRILESLGSHVEPATPTKGLDNQNDGRPEPKEAEELTVNLECKACMSQLIDTVVLPCGHAVLCRWCADQHMPSSRVDKTKPRGSATCPMCRKPVKQKIRIFLS